jgi:Na+/melibiose symporter-like transporter
MGITFTCPNSKSLYVLGKPIVSQVQLQLQFPNMFNLLLVLLNYLLPIITTHYLDGTNFFSCHNIMQFGISFTLEVVGLGNGNFTTPLFILVTTMLHKPCAIGAPWNVIPTTPHINPVAQGNPLMGSMISTFVFGAKLCKHVIIRNY